MKNLKRLRESKNLTQLEIANIIGVNRTTYTKYETGDSEPNIETLIKLANLFETSIDTIIGYKQKNKPTITEHEYFLIQSYRNKSLEIKHIVDCALDLKEKSLKDSNESFEIAFSKLPTKQK